MKLPSVTIETTLGRIIIQLAADSAPVTAANFLAYVDSGAYMGGRFHRTVTPDNQPDDTIRIAVIQGSINGSASNENAQPIALERTNITGLAHLDGSISMARREPDSAMSDFFICIGDQPELDFDGKRNPDGQGFAAFGRVTSGMDVVRAINASASERQQLSPPVPIVSIRRIE
jgi:peptidyl-prolyl cis-trans isomerase A (cyclophilin A)